MSQEHGVSVRQACEVVNLPRGTYRYKKKEKDDTVVIEQLQLLVEKHPSIGFWKCFYRIRRQGYTWNHKRVYRIYDFVAWKKRISMLKSF